MLEIKRGERKVDEPTKVCEACRQMIPDYPFKVGDKVRHMSGSEGIVDRVDKAVHVQFDGYRGEFDHIWFSAYRLTKI